MDSGLAHHTRTQPDGLFDDPAILKPNRVRSGQLHGSAGDRWKGTDVKIVERRSCVRSATSPAHNDHVAIADGLSTGMLGVTPTQYRAGGVDEVIRFAVGQCSLGAILVASSEKGVASILIDDDPEALVRSLQDRFPKTWLVGGDSDYELLVARVVGFVEALGLGCDLPLDVRGTAFQQRVWQALRNIPVGQTATYTEIARNIGAPKSVRAVAGACAANAIAVAIPCHRVVRNDGSLSGYRWGVERKRILIAREAAP
jgi:AraC family transcriptional regulator, regulatory protein of adaptative response / methylated-DNA-[protein]-cysteine methyltransferase